MLIELETDNYVMLIKLIKFLPQALSFPQRDEKSVILRISGQTSSFVYILYRFQSELELTVFISFYTKMIKNNSFSCLQRKRRQILEMV